MATAIVVAAVSFFLIPSQLPISSISSLAMVLTTVIPLHISTITFLLNAALLMLGFLFIGREFGGKTVYTSYQAIGTYDFKPRQEIITIVSRGEYRKLMDFIAKADQSAFITVYTVSNMSCLPKLPDQRLTNHRLPEKQQMNLCIRNVSGIRSGRVSILVMLPPA